MTENDDLSRPAPPLLRLGDIDRVEVHHRFTELIVAERPDLLEELISGGLVWHIDFPFDAHGWTSIRLVRRSTGEDTGASATCHWTAVVLPGVA